jgi:hypothetical protein
MKPQKTRWQPMERAVRIIPEKLRKAAETDPAVASHLEANDEMWKNDRYTVTVFRRDDGTVECLSIKRNDKGAVRDWRHMQKIKTELAGADAEGFQIFPAEDRLVDTANQTWIWCLPPGVRIPCGFTERLTGGPEEAEKVGASQREFEDGLL